MELSEFYDRVEAHSALKGVGVDSADADKPCVYVEYSDSGMVTRLPVAALKEAAWDLIEEILVGKREPVVLQHMTRVVGYYSRIENWNKSKIGELKDRHRGEYALAESAETA